MYAARVFRTTAGLACWLSAAAMAQTAPSTSGANPEADAQVQLHTLQRSLEQAQSELRDLRDEVRAVREAAEKNPTSAIRADDARALEFFEADGYLRIRPDLLHRFDLNRSPDPSGYTFLPVAPGTTRDRTQAGINMRFRFEPTLNVSEWLRIRSQIDVLDNVLFGSTPDYAFSRNGQRGFGWDPYNFSIFSQSQTAPRSGINSLIDSVTVKRVWGEVTTPFGLLKFGRMPSHWGLGMLYNDGSCIDCDYGDTVDRIMFVAEPLDGYYITPMLDFNVEGPSSIRQMYGGQAFDVSNIDDSHGLVIALARRDSDLQAREKLSSGSFVLNYGIHFTYRWQTNDAADFYGTPWVDEGPNTATANSSVRRNAQLFIPDAWLKFERKEFRLELEVAAVLGGIGNRAESTTDAADPTRTQGIGIAQLGAVLQGEYRLLDGALLIGGEVGFASGDPASGFGNYPRRKVSGANNTTVPGDIDGPQFSCVGVGTCRDARVTNFRFNRDFRPDLILYRELLGGVTDSLYFKPSVKYRVLPGLTVFGSAMYSRAIYGESTPSAVLLADGSVKSDANLGIELNVGARYQTDDGLFAQLQYAMFFPFGGFGDLRPGSNTTLDFADALRAVVGIGF